MPDIPDMQWCLPLRRQHCGVLATVDANAKGTSTPHAFSAKTKMASNRRILEATLAHHIHM
jgi:hypothetical protein